MGSTHATAPGNTRESEKWMTGSEVHLGYEVGTGTAVTIPLRHMVVTGQTQEAGKTTTLEALIARADVRAVTFVTKRGEGAFAGGRRLQPFFRERADWVFVSSLIDATMGEKNKLLRAWLMKVCRGTKTLAEVQRNVGKAKETARGFSESIYTEIEGYLELVVPQLAQLPPHTKVTIGDGLNVMDLAPYSTELQALVIRSVLEHVYEHEAGVVTVIPEAWEFLPEGRGSPVKRDAEALIRKGAGLKNYVWLDSQDLAGIWKLAVRAAPVVLIGVQREANEIKRTLANIPAGIAKPSAAAVAQLGLGQFYACHGTHVTKVYVQPAWMDQATARGVATGDVARIPAPPEEDAVNEREAAALRQENADLREQVGGLKRRIDELLTHRLPLDEAPAARDETPRLRPAAPPVPLAGDGEAIYQAIKGRLAQEAAHLLRVLVINPELEITVQRRVLEVVGDSLRGRVGRLLAAGFLDSGVTAFAVQKELARRGKDPGPANTYKELDVLAELGFFTIEQGKDDRGRARKLYRAVPEMKVNVVESAA